MKRWKKIAIGLGVFVVATAIAGYVIYGVGEHEGPGVVHPNPAPGTAIAEKRARQSQSNAVAPAADPRTPADKQILFGDLHVHTTFSVDAFLRSDDERAREIRTQGIRIDRLCDSIFHALVEEKPRRSSIELASLLTIFGKIERFSDQAKNICEETVFAGTGELKTPKVFRILFLDHRNDLLAHLATAIGAKSFSEGGVFEPHV